MNEHAKSIWQAWLDGKTIEYYHSLFWEWKEAHPCDRDVSYPQHKPDCWRVKPDTNTSGFRVYWDKEFEHPQCCAFFNHQSLIEKRLYFGGWLTDWIPYEVEVEE